MGKNGNKWKKMEINGNKLKGIKIFLYFYVFQYITY